MLIVDCHETAASTQAARYARDAGIPTIIDVEKVRPGIGDLLQNIDAIIAAAGVSDRADRIRGPRAARSKRSRASSAPRWSASRSAREGSLAWCDGREIRTPAFPVDCVDSTGAGDVFRGAFAAGCLGDPGGDIEDVLAYANAAAALNCRALGGARRAADA